MAADEDDDSAPLTSDEVEPAAGQASRLARLTRALVGPGSTPAKDGEATGKAVNELDARERRLTIAGIVLGTGLVISGYLVDRHSHLEKVRSASSTLLIAGIVVLVVMVLGAVFRRRAMVGFASFMVGFALITGGNIFGVLFLAFGGWLLVRAMKRQRGGAKSSEPATAKRNAAPKPAGPPKPSKRYTPPRRAGAGSRRR